jgi:hypothetical protein
MISIPWTFQFRPLSIFGKFLGNKRRRIETTNTEQQSGLSALRVASTAVAAGWQIRSRDERKRRSCHESEKTRNVHAFIA